MSYRRPIGRAENYTAPFLWSLGTLIFCFLFGIYAAFGALGVALSSYGFDFLVQRRKKRRDTP